MTPIAPLPPCLRTAKQLHHIAQQVVKESPELQHVSALAEHVYDSTMRGPCDTMPRIAILADHDLQLSESKGVNFRDFPQSGPEMSSIIRISDGFSAEFLGSFSHSQKFHRVRHAVFDEVAMEALKFGPSSQRPCLG